jgi:hypothetical protein
MNHGISLANEFQAFIYRLTQAGWKVDRSSRQGKIVLTTPSGATVNTSQPTSRADMIDLKSKCVQMGLR